MKKCDCYFYKSIEFTSEHHQLNKYFRHILYELEDFDEIEKSFEKSEKLSDILMYEMQNL